MRARLTWHEGPARNARSGRVGLRALEWTFLLVGLLAVDCFVWVNTSSVLYQAYEDWAFDQTLRGLTPSVSGFISDEARWLGSRGGEKAPLAESPQAPGAGLNEGPREGPASEEPNVTVPALRAVIGRLEIPRLKLSVMVREGADERT